MPQPLEFISVSGTNVKGDAETRKRVRSRAQADYRRRNPPPPRPALAVELDVPSWLNSLSQEATPKLYPCMKPTGKVNAKGYTNTRALKEESLSDDSNLFALMTPHQQQRAQKLWNHLYGGTCVVFKSMVEIGFINVLQGSAALTQMLSSASWHMNSNSAKPDEHSPEYAKYSVVATRSLRQLLHDPGQRASIEAILAILTFAAYANLISNPQLISMHLDGLVHALRYNGGLASVESMPIIRIMMFWIDTRGSYLQDSVPRFPQPFDILSTRTMLDLTGKLSYGLPEDEVLRGNAMSMRVLNHLHQVSFIIDAEVAKKGDKFWQIVLFPGFNLMPILHDLLSMPRFVETETDSQQCRMECFRLASILYITELRAKFHLDAAGVEQYAIKLLDNLRRLGMAKLRCASSDCLLWGVMIGSVSSCLSQGTRAEFQDLLLAHFNSEESSHDEKSWDTTFGFPWCESALGWPKLQVTATGLLTP